MQPHFTKMALSITYKAQDFFQCQRTLGRYDSEDGVPLGEAMMMKSKAEGALRGEKKKREWAAVRLRELFAKHKGLDELGRKHVWFEGMMVEILRCKLGKTRDVRSKLMTLSLKEGQTIGRGLAPSLATNLTGPNAVEEWVLRYPALKELEREYDPPLYNFVSRKFNPTPSLKVCLVPTHARDGGAAPPGEDCVYVPNPPSILLPRAEAGKRGGWRGHERSERKERVSFDGRQGRAAERAQASARNKEIEKERKKARLRQKLASEGKRAQRKKERKRFCGRSRRARENERKEGACFCGRIGLLSERSKRKESACFCGRSRRARESERKESAHFCSRSKLAQQSQRKRTLLRQKQARSASAKKAWGPFARGLSGGDPPNPPCGREVTLAMLRPTH
jgi:hypothetical protein